MAAAWLWRCCCCCCCREGDGGADSAGLLSSGKPIPAKTAPAPSPASRGDVYAVRQISRFGRAESKETLQGWADEPDDAADDEGAVSSDPRGPAPAPAPTPATDGNRRVPVVEVAQEAEETGSGVGAVAGKGAGGGGGGRPAPWQQLLRPQRLPKELAISTPDLARLPSSPPEPGSRTAATLRVPGAGAGRGGGLGSSLCLGAGAGGVALGASSSCLPRLTQRSSRSSSCTRRSGALSDSMESVDLSPEPRSPLSADVFGEPEDTATLARSVGLNMSLYSLGGDGDGQGEGEGRSPSQQPLWSPRRATQGDAGGGGGGGGQPASADDFCEQPRGSIAFTASYFQKNKKLSIQLNKLENLPPRGKDGVYDVIVRLCILPADKQIKTSKILRGSLSPLTEENFSFKVKEPVGKAVRFSVFNALLQGKHDAIGHALFNIEDVMSGRTRRYTMKLTHQSQLEPSFGSLQVYLQLSQERLIVDTIQARNLSISHVFKGARTAEKFNTFIKITFYSAGQKVKSKKSSVVTGDRNPRYEYSCDFKIPSNSVDDCYLVLSVVMKANLRKDMTLGRYIFGPYFLTESGDLTPWGRVVLNKEEVHHWFHLYL